MGLLREIEVFIASPSDVEAERAALRDVADRLNQVFFHRLGLSISVHGWEQTLPGYGRPQELINKAIESADLFIGLLWQRWGQTTGEYSSGFEEEFRHAEELLLAQGKPEIWLFFKDIDSDRLQDAGPQLARVLEFREETTQSKRYLYGSFNDLAGWRDQLEQFLTDFLWLRFQPTAHESEAESPERHPEAGLPAGESAKSGRGEPGQIAAALRRIITTESDWEHPVSVEDFDAYLRSYLFVAARVAESSSSTLGIHECYYVYGRRKQTQLYNEESYLTRTLLAGLDSAFPGWYWLRQYTPSRLGLLLLALALGDSSSEVKANAIDLLRAARVQPGLLRTGSFRRYVWETAVGEKAYNVKNAWLAYAVDVGTAEDLAIIMELANSKPDSISEPELFRLTLAHAMRDDPDGALAMASDKSWVIIPENYERIEAIIQKTSDEALMSAAGTTVVAMQEVVFRELDRRGLLVSSGFAGAGLSSRSAETRLLSARSLLTAGQANLIVDVEKLFEDVKEQKPPFLTDGVETGWSDLLKLSLLSGRSTDELLSLVDWYSWEAPLAYQLLATSRYAEFAETLRCDLNDEFEGLRERSKSQLASRYPHAPDDLWRSFEKGGEIRRLRFAVAAMVGIAANTVSKVEKDWVRSKLRQDDAILLPHALQAIRSSGDKMDVPLLLQIAMTSYRDTSTTAAVVAVELDRRGIQAVKALLASGRPDLVRTAILALDRGKAAAVQAQVEELLTHENGEIRMIAVKHLAAGRSRDWAERMLDRHMSKDFYYYNVASFLDVAAYAPAPYRKVVLARTAERS